LLIFLWISTKFWSLNKFFVNYNWITKSEIWQQAAQLACIRPMATTPCRLKRPRGPSLAGPAAKVVRAPWHDACTCWAQSPCPWPTGWRSGQWWPGGLGARRWPVWARRSHREDTRQGEIGSSSPWRFLDERTEKRGGHDGAWWRWETTGVPAMDGDDSFRSRVMRGMRRHPLA
jgi:hypothetical protein